MNNRELQYQFYICRYVEEKESDCRNDESDFGQFKIWQDSRDNYFGLSEFDREVLEMEGEQCMV